MAVPSEIELPISQAAPNMPPGPSIARTWDGEDGEQLEEDFDDFPCGLSTEEGPLTEQQMKALIGGSTSPQPQHQASSGTPTSASPTTPSSTGLFARTASPTTSLAGTSGPPSLIVNSDDDTASPPAFNRKRYRSKAAPKGYYMNSGNTPWRRLEKAREVEMKINFGLDTFEYTHQSKAGFKVLYDRTRKILTKYVKVGGGSGSNGASAANKELRRKIFGEMTLGQKQQHYEEVLRREQLSQDDKQVLLQFAGFSGWRGHGKSAMRSKKNLPTNGRLNTRALLVTYQSKKLRLKLEGFGGLDDVQLVEKLSQVPEVAKLVHELPEAMDHLVKRNHAEKFSWSLEICLQSYLAEYMETNFIRLHIHACLQRDLTPFRCRSLAEFLTLGGIEPSHLAGCSDPVSGRKAKGTLAMHYYNQMPKKGKVSGGTNYKAYDAFLVNPRWIAGYVQRNKMSIADAKEEPPFLSLNHSPGGFDARRPR